MSRWWHFGKSLRDDESDTPIRGHVGVCVVARQSTIGDQSKRFPDMPSIDVVIELSHDACLAHYEGRVGLVHTRSLDGRRVVFPAEALRRVVTRDGVHGIFRLHFSPEGRFQAIERRYPDRDVQR